MGTFASLNREVMMNQLLNYFKVNQRKTERISSIHNYISNNIIRKGAISAYDGEKVIIPFNMGRGFMIGTGKGNSDWNYSAPHGAGRLFSRNKAKSTITIEEFRESMKGVWSSCIDEKHLDEAPGAYKPFEEIIENISDTVEIEKIITPIYNFKG
jgi:RNA-splicing ligase RtcB